MFIRFQRSLLSVFLFSCVFVTAASASPLGAGKVCGKSTVSAPADSGQSGCAPLFPEPQADQRPEGAFLFEPSAGSVEFVRFLAPFSWNFASAFERLPASLRDGLAPLSRQARTEQVRGEDAYCDGGCSTTLSSVPEPATMVLFGSALLLLSAFVRNRVHFG